MPAPTASLQRREAEDRRALVDVATYEVDLDLSPRRTGDLAAVGAGFGSVTRVRFASGAGRTFLDLRPAALHAVRLDGAPLDVGLLDRGRLPLELSPGPHELVVEATMAFRNDGEGLHLAHDPADGEHYVYAMSFMDAAASWFACFDQPDLKATWSLRVSVPDDWTVVGNAPATEVAPGRWELGPTQPLPTYLVTMVAGPWHVVHDEHDGIPLGLSARASLATELERDAEDLLTVTRQSFDELHRLFGIRYPFGDYHQAFVPEFNAGAMENPGCVTFRDSFLSSSRLTRGVLAGRASTVAHEMAHQWFGNLVTPAWWDDLWLNESFAEYLGNRVTAECTQYADIWVDDVHARRQWGLVADQRPTTHPVAGNGALDAAAALQDFDGISYAKGASVLKQLCTRLGDEVFFAGVVDHFTRHRFANATMHDLVGSWERAGAGDLSAFVGAWLRTSGPDRLELDREAGVLRRTPPAGHPADRAHAVGVAVHRGGAWRRERVTLSTAETPFAVGDEPVLLDPDCDTWALSVPDPVTVTALRGLLPEMTDPLLRATTWSSLRSAFHNARLDPRVALELVVAALPVEDPNDDVQHLRNLAWVYRYVIPLQTDPDAARARVHQVARVRCEAAGAGSEEQLAALRVLVATSVDEGALTAWRNGEDLPRGARLDVDLLWRVLARLAEVGGTDARELDRALSHEPTATARVEHARARASLPTAEAKAWAWDRFTGAVDAPNHEVEAAGLGLWRPGQDQVTQAYVDRYFDELPATVAVRSGWALAEAAEQFFPWTSLEASTVERAEALAADPALDVSLRRRLADQADQLRRMRAVREAFSW